MIPIELLIDQDDGIKKLLWEEPQVKSRNCCNFVAARSQGAGEPILYDIIECIELNVIELMQRASHSRGRRPKH